MALICHVCHNELEAGACSRCQVCKQLVCASCLSSSSGVTCVSCAEQAKHHPQEAADETGGQVKEKAAALPPHGLQLDPPGSWTRLRSVPGWSLLSFFVLLLGLFAFIAVYPGMRARRLALVVEGPSPSAARAAADSLVRDANGASLRALGMVAQHAKTEPARAIAIEALGRFPDPRAGDYLNVLQGDRSLSDALKALVEESLLRQRQFVRPESR